MAGSNKLSLLAKERRVVNSEQHRHGRLVYSNGRQCLWIFRIADGITNLKVLQTDNGTDITTVDTVNALVTHSVEGMQFFDFGFLHRTITVSNGHQLAVLQLSTVYTSDSDTSGV